MSNGKIFGSILVASLMIGATMVPGASAAFPLPLFLIHPPGGLLLAKAGGKQVFKTAAGSIECTALKLLPPGDTAPATLQALKILIAIDYEKCTAFGFTARFHPFQYLVDANGLVTQENTVLVLALECTITFPATKNQSLTKVLFHNSSAANTLLLLWQLSKVTSVGAGAACTYAEESNGIWAGDFQLVAHGATLRWDP